MFFTSPKKRLRKELLLAVEWTAAEYKFIKELQAELKNITQETKVREEVKEISRAVSLLKHVGRAERRAAKFQERTKKNLAQYSEHLRYYNEPQIEIQDKLQQVIRETKIEYEALVNYASRYEGLLRQELTEAEAQIQLQADIEAEHPQKAALIHASVLRLLAKIQQKVYSAEQWVAALEASLKKALELFERGTTASATSTGMRILKTHGFPIDKYPDVALFMAQHPDDLNKMVNAVKKSDILFTMGLTRVTDIINERTWPGIVEMTLAAEENATDLLNHGLPIVIKVADSLAKNNWPMVVEGFVKMSRAAGKNAGELFRSVGSGPTVYLLNEKDWPLLVDGFCTMAKTAGKYTHIVFSLGLDRVRFSNKRNWPIIVESLPKLAQAAGNGTGTLFHEGFNAVSESMYAENYPALFKMFLAILEYCRGTEKETYESLKSLRYLFSRFGMKLIDLLIIPTLKRQKPASFLCFRSYENFGGTLETAEDFDLVIRILNERKYKANDFFQHIIIAGLREGVIATPLSKEKEYLLLFLENSTLDLIEVYKEYKRLLTSDHPEKMKLIEKMFRDFKDIKKDIFNGILSKEYDQKMLGGVLYSVFNPELTIPRESYLQTYNNRTDRQADIPEEIQKLSPEEVKISSGGYALRAGEELNDEAWKNVVEVVAEVNSKPLTIVPEFLGLELLRTFATRKLLPQQKEFLKKIYAFSVQRGQSLPEFNADHSTLMKYKEYVGDRLRNDLIASLIDAAFTKKKEEFAQLMQILEKPQNYDGLAKTLFGLWMSDKTDKVTRIKAILEKNNINVEHIDWKAEKWQDVRDWLQHQSAGTVSKKLINDIFAMLIGEDYNKMQQEMDKFEHSHHASGRGGQKFIFMLSKRHPHSIAMYNMGVCIAPDDKLWNMPDFWQLIIFDEDFHAHGGVIYRTIREWGKKYLVVSIQPASTILSQVSPVHLYDQIIEFSEKMRKKLDYSSLLISTSSAIHSNRGSIQAIITQKRYPVRKLSMHEFSYAPYHYTYNDFFIVR